MNNTTKSRNVLTLEAAATREQPSCRQAARQPGLDRERQEASLLPCKRVPHYCRTQLITATPTQSHNAFLTETEKSLGNRWRTHLAARLEMGHGRSGTEHSVVTPQPPRDATSPTSFRLDAAPDQSPSAWFVSPPRRAAPVVARAANYTRLP